MLLKGIYLFAGWVFSNLTINTKSTTLIQAKVTWVEQNDDNGDSTPQEKVSQ